MLLLRAPRPVLLLVSFWFGHPVKLTCLVHEPTFPAGALLLNILPPPLGGGLPLAIWVCLNQEEKLLLVKEEETRYIFLNLLLIPRPGFLKLRSRSCHLIPHPAFTFCFIYIYILFYL